MTARSFELAPMALALIMIFAGASSGAADAEKNPAISQAEIEQKLEAAQKRLDAAASEIAELSMSLSEHVVPHVRSMVGGRAQRAMLGVNLGPRDRDEPDDGVRVMSVSPGGAGVDAGLKADDVLLELNGKTLKREGEASPRDKLVSAMREVKAGDKVSVRYRRDGKINTANVIAQAPPDRLFTMALPHAGMRRFEGMEFPYAAFVRAEGVFGSAELAPLTPKLGQYFGTDKGLLVVRAPEDSRLQLEDGDVILDIDGRTPSSPSHAFRILGSYQPGEKLKLNILRAKKRMAFEIAIPEGSRGNRMYFERRAIPARPATPPGPAEPFNAPIPPPGTVSLTGPGGDQSV